MLKITYGIHMQRLMFWCGWHICSQGRERSLDIISMLVGIYGSKELFINEYRCADTSIPYMTHMKGVILQATNHNVPGHGGRARHGASAWDLAR